jgi:hypothetical protein
MLELILKMRVELRTIWNCIIQFILHFYFRAEADEFVSYHLIAIFRVG